MINFVSLSRRYAICKCVYSKCFVNVYILCGRFVWKGIREFKRGGRNIYGR